jgi:hypothetical protein
MQYLVALASYRVKDSHFYFIINYFEFTLQMSTCKSVSQFWTLPFPSSNLPTKWSTTVRNTLDVRPTQHQWESMRAQSIFQKTIEIYNHVTQVLALPSFSLSLVLILITHSRLDLSGCLFPSYLTIKSSHAGFLSPFCDAYPSQLTLF